MRGEAAGTDAGTIPLPAYGHLPGINRRPDDGLLQAVIARAPAETRTETAATNVAWCYGVRLINEGFFWEAHEVLEPVWQRARPNSRERFLAQVLIHLANGALKQRMGRARAARRLVALAADCRQRAFDGIGGRLMGIDASEAAEAGALIEAGSTDFHLSLDGEL